MTFYTIGISVGGAALTASVTAIYPILGTALAVLILKEKTGLQTWIGLVVSVIGIIVIGWSPSSGGETNLLLGILISLVAAIGWATEGVVSGYGMKDGNVDPKMALVIRYIVSSIVYLFIVAPIFAGGFVDSIGGYAAIFSDTSCGILLAVTALIGMSSFLCWYMSIDNIRASKALCLNVTYSFWSVVFTLFLSLLRSIFSLLKITPIIKHIIKTYNQSKKTITVLSAPYSLLILPIFKYIEKPSTANTQATTVIVAPGKKLRIFSLYGHIYIFNNTAKRYANAISNK
jgi:drug/metabolite transporter (DMT)-like permease